jgi:hypothetical protein
MRLYVYCVVSGMDTLPDQALKGLSGGEVRLVSAGNLEALVSEFEGDIVPITGDHVIAHQRVIRSLLDLTTPLPVRFGTLASEAQLGSYLAGRQTALLKRLDAVRGCVEMSVKVIWPTSSAATPEIGSSNDKTMGIGTAFLTAKREAILGDVALAKEATDLSLWLKGNFSSLIRDEQVNLRPRERMVLAADHLVERERLEVYRNRLSEVRQERPDLHFLLSGPWPPYSFANIDLEFKSQFGVS